MMAENFNRFVKMQDISSMQVYRETLRKMRTCPTRCGTVGKCVYFIKFSKDFYENIGQSV